MSEEFYTIPLSSTKETATFSREKWTIKKKMEQTSTEDKFPGSTPKPGRFSAGGRPVGHFWAESLIQHPFFFEFSFVKKGTWILLSNLYCRIFSMVVLVIDFGS